MLNPYIEGWELRELLRKREIRPREAAEFFLARIEKLNPALGAFVTITPERALADPELLDPVIIGTWKAGREITAAQYINALTMMHNLSREIVQQLAPYDALVTPTLTRPALRLGTMPSPDPWKIDKHGKRVHDIYTWTAFAFPFNATGQPAVSIPMGFNRAGLPLGLQIVGRPNDEAGIIALSAQFEEARPWKNKLPPVEPR